MKEKGGVFVSVVLGMLTAFGPFVALSLWFALSLPFVLAAFAIMLVGFGLLAPVVTSQALDGEHDNAGAASAIIGATAFLSGAIVSPIVTIGSVAVSTGIVIAVSALLCFVSMCVWQNEQGDRFRPTCMC
ncbi:MAG: hypothetical protein MJY77_02660 [Bacteroidaceae bacterium]|nr:hypothetical protein [Bacteroidaceae bacterium]